ncbi:MAG: aminodeoxychorismate/anthranilate synthase component II [Clostridiales bacterium]|jgi:anthranilate synthase component 2|nr:aminodeoxychorismate/anthranilate synthase component II [Clostridiales bacterium]
MTLLIDNYDSFSYNLYQLIGSFDPGVTVVRNDAVTVEKIAELGPERIVLSPGPGRPESAGVCIGAVKRFCGAVPVLGVCLGHQAICEAFGTPVIYARRQVHGKPSVIKIDNSDPLFDGLPESVTAARYHSLAADANAVSDPLRVLATADDGEIMAVRHKDFCVYGIQFHPESVMTPCGATIIGNFLKMRETGRVL